MDKIKNCADCAFMKMTPGWRAARCMLKKQKRGDGYVKRWEITPGRQWEREIRPRKGWRMAEKCEDFESMDGEE